MDPLAWHLRNGGTGGRDHGKLRGPVWLMPPPAGGKHARVFGHLSALV